VPDAPVVLWVPAVGVPAAVGVLVPVPVTVTAAPAPVGVDVPDNPNVVAVVSAGIVGVKDRFGVDG
jgi:hypothetical protein